MTQRESRPQARPLGKLHIGISKSAVVNQLCTFELLRQVGAKMCILNATHPGFLGYQAHRQVGVAPAAGRYGGGSIDMRDELNPVGVYQYTVWKSSDDHVDFHADSFARFMELCSHCLPILVEGPTECLYQVAWAELGQASPQRCVVISELQVREGCQERFEDGMYELEQAMGHLVPGYLGSMLLEGVGLNPWGSLMLDSDAMVQMLTTLGAHPPTHPRPLFDIPESRPTPPRYLLHSEWESAQLIPDGLTKVMTDFELRTLYQDKVQRYLVHCSPERVFEIMGEQPGWRRCLQA